MSEEKRELEPVFENCPNLYQVDFEIDIVFVFAENRSDALKIAESEIPDEVENVTVSIVCFANSIINLDKVFK